MRILIATDAPRQWEAGTAAVLLNDVRELRNRGHHVECWFREDILDKPVWLRRITSLLFAARVARRIRNSRKNYDVVDLHIPVGSVYGLWRRIFRPKGAPPYVFTMQGILERHSHAMRREQRKGKAWHFGWKNRLWYRLYHRTLFDCAIKTADYGVVSNREAWTYSELKHDREPGRIWYVPNGVENCFFLDREFENEKISPIRLLFVGTWLDRKGVHYLAEAFQELARRRTNVQLTVAGCLCTEGEVKRFFAPDVRCMVNVLPFVRRDEMPAVYGDHDIFVFPSLMEGMPLALLEAMAASMPVVTTETCGMADIVEDGFNGLLVPPANSERLVEAIEQLCDSVQLRRQLGKEAQQTMRRYTWERVTKKLEMVLSLAVQSAQDSHPF